MQLAIQLPLYRGSQYLPALLAALARQTWSDWHLFVLEQSESDEEWARVQSLLEASDLPVTFARSEKNLGFAGGHQTLFEQQDAPFTCLLNQDAFPEPEYLERLLAFLHAHPQAGAVTGAIARAEWEDARVVTTPVIDSLGLEQRVTLRVKDRAAGESVALIPPTPTRVFGVSGCFPVYRREAVLKAGGYLFDPAYFLYKEDVDLAYRLQKVGVESWLVPQAVAAHVRTTREGLLLRSHSDLVERLSYRNHLWNLIQHIPGRTLALQAWAWIPYELAKAGYQLMRSPAAWVQALIEVKERWPLLMERRRDHWSSYEAR